MEDGKLATAHSRMSQLPPSFSKASNSHTANVFFFVAEFLVKVKKFHYSPSKLILRPEVGGSDLYEVDGG